MKKLHTTIACLLILTSVFAQKDSAIVPKSGFASIGMLFTTAFDNGFGVSIGGGARIGKHVTLGMGVDLMKFVDVESIYIPGYLDLRVFVAKGLFIFGQGGYSGYSHSLNESGQFSVKTSGGVYWGAGAGYFINGNLAPFILARASSYEFNTKYGSASMIDNTKTTEVGLTLTVGMKF